MWWLTLHRWTDPPDANRDGLEKHLHWVQAMHTRGRVLFSGPCRDTGMGIIVLRGDDMDRAGLDTLLAEEPLVAAGLRTYDVIAWDVRQVLGIGAFALGGAGPGSQHSGPAAGSARTGAVAHDR